MYQCSDIAYLRLALQQHTGSSSLRPPGPPCADLPPSRPSRAQYGHPSLSPLLCTRLSPRRQAPPSESAIRFISILEYLTSTARATQPAVCDLIYIPM
ncbi:hypothetical protein OH77DRAFT_1037730 [Trametes cingulata]|nr:hypothetical protein OH77DRAFT_1037730 [Trametes cingulata]